VKKQYTFYVTDFAPNGSQDLIVADREGNIIITKSEAIWGLHVNPNRSKVAMNTVIVDDPELRRCLMDAPEDLCLVYDAKVEVLLRHIAVSPVNDGIDTIEFIKRYAKMA
jgi:hypothetical protein